MTNLLEVPFVNPHAASQGSWISLTKLWVATYSVGGERPGMGELFHRIACL